MPRCTLCHQDLPESDFYPSALKKGQYQCRKCTYEHYQKKSNKKYSESLKQLDEIDFDRFYGGFNIKVLNYPRPNEYKYVIMPTRGKTYVTNSLEDFMGYLWEELKQEK